MATDILVIDDEADIRELISDILVDEGFTPRLAGDSRATFEAIDARVPSALILDVWLQGSELDGLGILEQVKKQYPHMPVIVISGHGNIETAISAIRLGAYDYLEKPFKEDKLVHLLNRAIENARLKHENEELRIRATLETELVGKSQALLQLKQTLQKVAATSSRVLITGPAGCGKEVVARQIHRLSARAKAPFIVLNAASISPERFDAELFGAEGENAQHGVLERAHGGTLFIDEVADMPLPVQGKILRILQENSFERMGSGKRVEIDVRVIAATNRNLQYEMENGNFREDLYYRLNVVPIHVPPLKERREDIAPLTEYFVKRCASMLGVTPRPLDDGVIAVMEAYDWPGNVRQLRNVMEWLLIMAPTGSNAPIQANALPPELLHNNPVTSKPENNADIMAMPLRAAREVFEKQYLLAQISRFSGNISKTAEFVGMERSALHRKLKTLQLQGEAEREESKV